MTANIISVVNDSIIVTMFVSVLGDGSQGTAVEYSGSTLLHNADGTQKPIAQLKTELVAACKAKRDSLQPVVPVVVAGISGSVNL